jgi:hypothetical protein
MVNVFLCQWSMIAASVEKRLSVKEAWTHGLVLFA